MKPPKRFARKLPVVEVVWADCVLVGGGWTSYRETMGDRKRVWQRSVGYVLADDREGIVLSSSLSASHNTFGTVIIPHAQIISTRRIR